MANFLKSLFIKGVEIDTASAITGNSLIYNGTKFAPATPGSGSIALDGLSDVVITTPEEFQGLLYNGTSWVNSYAPVSTYVRNAEATTLTIGTCVYLFGATGDHASVKRADNNSDTTSSKTIGVAGASITASNNGPIITRGYVDGIDLSVGYTAGDVLWLGEAGAFTTTKPTAPDHLVFIGVVVRATNNGIIYVATQNGYELDELHNVSLPSPASGDFLKYNGSLWVADAIDLGTDTTGNYMSGISGTSPVSVAHTAGEGSSATVSLAASYGDTQNPYASKTANYVLAAPNGTAGVPTFRAIVAADIPTLNQNTTGSAATVTGAAQTAITSVGTLSALRVDGNFGIGGAGFAQIGLRFVKDIGGSAFSQGIFLGGAIQATVTNRADMIWTAPTVAASVTLPTLHQFYATLAGVGSGSTITTATGFYAESNIGNNDLGTITNAYGFRGNIASGTGRYNLYMGGTADNHMAGRLGVGAVLTSGIMAIVQNTTAADKAFVVKGAASQSGDFFDIQNSGGTSQFKVNSVGNVGVSDTPAAGRSFSLGKTMTGSIAPIGVFSAGQIQSDATNSANYFNTYVSTAATAFTCGTAIHYKTQQGTIGAGSSIGTQVGFLAESSLTGATGNNLGFWGAIPADAAKNYNLYMSGTAPNYLLGRLGVGAGLTSGAMAQINNTTAGDKAFVVKGHATQSGSLFEIQNSSGTALVTVNSSGDFVGPVNSIKNFGNGLSHNFCARADSSAQGLLAGYSFYPTFTGTGDNTVRRAADISAGFTGAWGTEYLSFGVGISATNDAAAKTTERMRIDGAGNVGIGTNSPSSYGLLSVSASISASTTKNMIAMQQSAGVDSATMRIAGYAYTGNARTAIDFVQNAASNFNSQMVFSTSAGADAVERMRIAGNGDVGIGTSSPTVKLQVTGSTHLTGAGTFPATGTGIELTPSVAGGTNYIQAFSRDAGTWQTLAINSGLTAFSTAGTERMRITGAGLVGIGTSSPSQTLDVNGGTKSNFYEEKATVSATAATGTIAVNAKTTGITYYTTNATANFVLNLRGDSSTTLSSLTAVGDTMTISFLNTNGATAYYPTSIQIDGTVTGVTTKWQGGTAPSAGNASSIDSYVFMVIKTAATPTYTVLASQTKFA